MSDRVEVTAGPLVSGGDALVKRAGQKVLFVQDALPGERVEVELTRRAKDLERGVARSVLDPSPDRVPPPCPMFDVGCGGCQWQHASAPAQGRYKVDIVGDALERIAKKPDASVQFGGSVDPFGYRTTVRFAVADGRAALHRRASDHLVALDTCLIAHPRIAELAIGCDFGDATRATIRVSVTTGERMVFTDATSRPPLPEDVTVTNSATGAVLHETVLDRTFRISAGSFFQSGHQAASLLASTVDAVVPANARHIVDAYAGVGLLGSVVASRRPGSRLAAVEMDGPSLTDARHNLADVDAEILAMEVAHVEPSGLRQPDVVIADPPRTGLGRSASASLAALKASCMVLVSCDPASLARDTNLLAGHGYELHNVTVLDLFPQTHHVETVSLFARS